MGKVMTRHQRKMMTCNTRDNENSGFVRERVRQQWENLEEQLATPEPILRQQGKVVRPQWCTCLDGFWMRNLVDPQCHYHGDYGYELRDLLTRAADALQDLDRFAFYCWSARNEKFPQLIAELRKAAQ
jgi:hypothetical protein